MVKRALTRVSLALTSMLLATMAFGQTDDYPKTEFGHPDLQGTYTFRTITLLIGQENWSIWKLSPQSKLLNGSNLNSDAKTET